MQHYFVTLKEKIVEQDKLLASCKKELQRLYAPKVKIILQSVALQDESFLKHPEPRKNVEAAKNILKEYFHMGEEVLDDSFFKYFLRDFEPVIASEVDKISLQIM